LTIALLYREIWNIYLVLLFLTLAGGLLSASEVENLERAGFTVEQEQAEGNVTEYELVDESGRSVIVVAVGELTRNQVDLLDMYVDRFFAWEHMTIDSFTVVFYEEENEIQIVPSELVYKDVKLTEVLPSGFSFYCVGNAVEYAFRVKVDERYPRLSGTLSTEEALYEEILALLENTDAPPPVQQRARVVPGDLADRLEDLAVRMDEVESENDDLRSENESLRMEFNELKSQMDEDLQKIDRLDEAIRALEERMSKIGDPEDGWRAEYSELSENLDKLRRAVMVFHNKGIFGNIREVSREGITLICERKAENPEFTHNEAADALDREGISMSAHEIFLVLSIYFNEFQ